MHVDLVNSSTIPPGAKAFEKELAIFFNVSELVTESVVSYHSVLVGPVSIDLILLLEDCELSVFDELDDEPSFAAFAKNADASAIIISLAVNIAINLLLKTDEESDIDLNEDIGTQEETINDVKMVQLFFNPENDTLFKEAIEKICIWIAVVAVIGVIVFMGVVAWNVAQAQQALLMTRIY